MTQCRDIVRRVNAGDLDEDDLIALLERLQAARDAAEGVENVQKAVYDKGRVIAGEMELAAKIAERNRLQNVVIESRLKNQIALADSATGRPSAGLEAALGGVNTPFSGSMRSVDGLAKTMLSARMGGLVAEMRTANVLKAFTSADEEMERQIAKVLAAHSTPDVPTPKVSPEAKAIGDIMFKYQRASLERANRAGAYIRLRKGYIVSQTHEMDRMRRAGLDVWKAEARQRFDFAAMEIPAARIDDALDAIYHDRSTGIGVDADPGPVEKAFKGPGNLAKRISQSRTILFKSSDDMLAYNKRFGMGSLRESFMADLAQRARATALMEVFGTNPQAMLDKLTQWGAEHYKADPDKAKGFLGGVFNLQHMMDEVTGAVNMPGLHPGQRTLAVFGRSYRAMQTMAKLGGSVISSTTDVVFGAQLRMFHGRNFFGAWGDAFRALSEGMVPGDMRVFHDLIGAGMESQMGNFMSRFSIDEPLSGNISKALSLYFKMNLLGPWTNANKRGMAAIVSRWLAQSADNPFGKLDPDLKRTLEIYGIDARQWDVIRAARVDAPDGRAYIMPGDVDDVTGQMFTGLSGPQQQALRDKTRENLFSLIVNETDFSSPTPGARERAFMRRGTPAGSAVGEALRFMWQFKSFGVTVISKVMGRQLYGKGARTFREAMMSGQGHNMGMVNLVVMSTFVGMLTYAAKEVMKGRKPPDFTDPKTFIAGALQGGGMGIYGDFLFGETNRYFGGMAETVLGPGIGAVFEVIDIAQRAKTAAFKGEQASLMGDLIRAIRGNTPFANLFYLKNAMDYLIWFQLMEATNPGYLRRTERRHKSEGRDYWLPPSSIVATGGGFR